MAEYRIYRLDAGGHIIGPPIETAAPDDQAAIARARTMNDHHSVEVWCGNRMVHRMETAANMKIRGVSGHSNRA